MALDEFNQALAEVTMDQYMRDKRPPEHIRPKLDFTYKIENQSITVLEQRPHFQDSSKVIDTPVIKTTYSKVDQLWKIYWMRQDLKWHPYEPKQTVITLDDFLDVLEEDKHGCFWG